MRSHIATNIRMHRYTWLCNALHPNVFLIASLLLAMQVTKSCQDFKMFSEEEALDCLGIGELPLEVRPVSDTPVGVLRVYYSKSACLLLCHLCMKSELSIHAC